MKKSILLWIVAGGHVAMRSGVHGGTQPHRFERRNRKDIGSGALPGATIQNKGNYL